MKARLVTVSALALLAGCSNSDNAGGGEATVQAITVQEPEGGKEFGLQEAMVSDAASEAASASGSASEAASGAADRAPATPLPQQRIAYSYRVGYELDADEIGTAQAAHMALCDKLGAARCRIKSMERGSDTGAFTNAALKLAVDARVARTFQADLDKAVDAAGGELSSRGIEAEDLAKQMVDADARIKAKQALADRLLGVIKSRSGSVADLVAAERAYAEAQEELEAAKGWMTEMQTRVALSDVDIRYASTGPVGSGWLRPVGLAAREAGSILGESMATLIRFIVAVLPWMLALTGLVWLWRKRGWRAPWPKRWRRNDQA
jgi:hypothetical protein